MDANREKLLLKDEVFQIVSCAIEVLMRFGHGLMLNYLRITGLRVGVILNFKHRKLQWERIALENSCLSCPRR